ncbi:dihydrolipoyl dehydrogenase family protein [Rhodovibrio salinarum]|uniref:Dihydrolipoamide dehydrogenase n=1 Tax=Rhodovibrio salinarum TaxID=1087 RepID=A0A934QH69_9PROT|nr:FAD-dependent oxidoreductase [Rhodovibrio salinarum]MBK1696729.1 dihydrolipoamide dehydrogenase [Rhodovibrio salinarum]
MTETLTPDLCVIGAGSAGLAVAAGAQQMGADTVLVERGKMGGDCLNTGCVPSKALLAAGKAAQLDRLAAKYGLTTDAPQVDFAAVHRHVHDVIASIAPHDSVARFEGLGVRVVQAHGAFEDPRTLTADGVRIRPRRFVLATGSTAAVPPIPGIDKTPYLTNETVFDLTERPDHLIVIGGGPIGTELGQAFAHLGSRVSIVEMASLLPRDDPDMVAVLRAQLHADGLALYESTQVTGVSPEGNGVAVDIARDGQAQHLTGSHLLIAAGRKVNLDGLNLEAAGIARTANGGLQVDARLRTTNRRVFAAGDVAGGPQFTHVAGYHAGIVIKNALFRLPAKADHGSVPQVTYTTPEIASVGLGEAAARARYGDKVRTLTWPFADNDRARAERTTEGMIRVVVDAKGRVLGAAIAGAHAGELIYPWILAVQRKEKVGAIAQMIAPYPTFGEISKRAAGSFYTPSLFSERTRKIVRLLAKLG